MLGPLHPFDFPLRERSPARRASEPTPAPTPRVTTAEAADKYSITLAPPTQAGWTLEDAHATLTDGRLCLLGTLVQNRVEYVTRRRAGVYHVPSTHGLVGVLPPGQIVSGGLPTRSGWIALDDDESWMLDDGSLAVVTQPGRARPFAKTVALPADADLRHATSERLSPGGLLVDVPRLRPPREAAKPWRAAPGASRPPARAEEGASVAQPPNQPPPKMKKAPPRATAAHEAATSRKASRANEQAGRADEKRHAAAPRGMNEALHAALGGAGDGPVLAEVDAPCEEHVQSPREEEEEEEWLATADGGFVRSAHGDGELAYWGF